MKSSKIFLPALLTVFFALLSGVASAATMTLNSSGQNFSIGQEFTVDLSIDTEDKNINAAQAVISFPKNILEFVSIDRSKSVFGFWVEDPVVSNGSVSFIGGTSQSLTGRSLLVFTMKFKTVGSGKGDFSISEAIVAAGDGQGTNVLSSTKTASINVSTQSVRVPAPVQEEPIRVTRPPIKAAKAPAAPGLAVNLYPDPTKWYNQQGDLIVLWNLPDDVTQVAALVDHNPKTIPSVFDKELFNGKNFGVPKEGIWYAHVRFKNNIGVGPTAHYRVAVDYTAPPAFGVVSLSGNETDNPQPVFRYSANDALSGIANYVIHIGANEDITTTQEEIKLPLQSPGRRDLVISAVDKAGNETSAAISINILPIQAPNITFITKDVFVGEGNLVIGGTAKPGFLIHLIIKSKSGTIAAQTTVPVAVDGNWEVLINEPLKKGTYFAEAVTQDERGALSFPVASEEFRVKTAPLLTVAGIGITQFGFFSGLIVVLLAAFGAGFWAQRLWKKQLGRKLVIAERDVTSVFGVLKKDLDNLLGKYKDKKISAVENTEIEFLLKKTKTDLEKMQKYVADSINDLSR